MKEIKLKRFFAMLFCFLLVFTVFPVFAYADTGPKPSVHVMFEGLGDELCYATLLSRYDSTGPSSAWDGNEETARHNENEYYSYEVLGYDDWRAFVEYEDTDGFYFLQEAWQVNETKELAWTYYPPDEFKVLLYFPESGTFAVSDICKRYAFDSYFTVDMRNSDVGSIDYNEELSSNKRLDAYRSYNFRRELVSLFARIIITVIIELAVALLFGYTKRKQLLLLAGVNFATQIILNVLLNIINYNSGQTAYVIFYILFEFIVFVIEAWVYHRYLDRFGTGKRSGKRAIFYALTANALSFAAGMYISVLIPEIF